VLFTGLTTVILVFFSEKVYWYVQGYAYAELVLYYAFPVYACLWTIDHFRVRRLPALVLVAALYALLTLVGGGLFVWAVLAILWRSRTQQKGM
jgi:hypothetical protein